MEMTITNETWNHIIKRIHSSSICARHCVIQFKVVHRLHYSKEKLAKMNPTIDSTCDRCKKDTASLFHMFWSCPLLTQFWQSIFETLARIFRLPLQPSPLSAIFGVVPAGADLNATQANLLAYTTLLARRLILFKWKDPKAPSYAHWIREVMQSLKLEKIRYTMRGTVSKFYLTWKPFLDLVEESDAQSLTEVE